MCPEVALKFKFRVLRLPLYFVCMYAIKTCSSGVAYIPRIIETRVHQMYIKQTAQVSISLRLVVPTTIKSEQGYWCTYSVGTVKHATDSSNDDDRNKDTP